MQKTKTDFLTVIFLSAFSFMLATAVHEHGGHSLACLAQGGKLTELGAFYVDCAQGSLSLAGSRIVALAGPLASFLMGVAAMLVFGGVSRVNAPLKFFLWHFATVNLMVATGYMLFSGVAGIGDFGTGESGVFYQAQPEWVYRLALSVAGLVSYFGVVLVSLRKLNSFIGGEGIERIRRAQTLSLLSYLAGGASAILIGFLNPHGIIIVLISSVASCVGGTSGLAWMMQMLNRKKDTGKSPFVLERSWAWIGVSAAFLIAYAIIFGRTIFL